MPKARSAASHDKRRHKQTNNGYPAPVVSHREALRIRSSKAYGSPSPILGIVKVIAYTQIRARQGKRLEQIPSTKPRRWTVLVENFRLHANSGALGTPLAQACSSESQRDSGLFEKSPPSEPRLPLSSPILPNNQRSILIFSGRCGQHCSL